MTAYVKMVADYIRAPFVGDDAGQNMVETALIIGLMSLVLVVAFVTTGITTAVGNLAEQVACVLELNSSDPVAVAACDAL